MKFRLSLFCTILLLACSENNFDKKFLLFELRLAQLESSPGFVATHLYNSDKKFYISEAGFLTNNEIVSAEIIDWETQPKVKVILNEKGRETFAEFTRRYTGKSAAILIDHKLVSAPKIHTEINEGILLIVGQFNHHESLSIAEGIVLKD